jgi:predicted tellurium resistance membrane protein TerC
VRFCVYVCVYFFVVVFAVVVVICSKLVKQLLNRTKYLKLFMYVMLNTVSFFLTDLKDSEKNITYLKTDQVVGGR